MARKQISVDEDLVGMLDKWAAAKKVEKTVAYDRFARMSIVRNNALAKYAKRKAAGEVGTRKAKAKKAKAA